ncbi:hypothetical protein [Actinorugispora endophytica]|uniref:Essential protein Yae1 N-terminal domain-containing protein n=1 Tax=Actinorugispora endophytica TaxID=1605990 RepID=A0A4R6UL11_9ACTN|nr:hypothetical protein [Actinorugispora endophytica]TDQ47571.1 hypothetical protein EV190_12139 [Actinorugispora endophytica]
MSGVGDHEISGTYEYKSAFVRRYVAEGIEQGMVQGIFQGLDQGLDKGLEKGLEKGLKRGLAQGRARSILTVLSVRDVEVAEEKRERILDCADLEVLSVWLRRAVTARTVAELFD